jgi:hypothetical protein
VNVRTWLTGAAVIGMVGLGAPASAATPSTTSGPRPPMSAKMQGVTEAGYAANVFTTYATRGRSSD